MGSAILEVIQGPCVGNQHFFALNTDLIETANRLLRAKYDVRDCDKESEIELKKCILDIFQGLLEGQGTKVAIYEKVLNVIHMDVIVYMAVGDDDEEDKISVRSFKSHVSKRSALLSYATAQSEASCDTAKSEHEEHVEHPASSSATRDGIDIYEKSVDQSGNTVYVKAKSANIIKHAIGFL